MKRLQTLLMTKKLPRDFQEDQVKIIPLPSSQAIRDLAERPLAGNRRNWFNQCFPVPENRDVNKMQARFQAEVFIVEVSKATTRQPCPAEETTTTDEDPIPPNLSVGEGGGQEKSMTSQLSQIHEREHINQIQINGKTSSVRLQEVDTVVIALEDTILSVAAKLNAAPPLKVFNPIFSLKRKEKILLQGEPQHPSSEKKQKGKM
ncbi:hypothetical protein OIU84_020181 [Salix udensis]|uniref:Uncharacterized protein n=1 Tax=Salix udensis TaxID=889485 RepID=A0AAD6L0P0_9ROSI|nr:hypothetical protein OIU84_020181 [Salix udensis]